MATLPEASEQEERVDPWHVREGVPQVLAGERGEGLLAGLDEVDTRIVTEVLQGLQG